MESGQGSTRTGGLMTPLVSIQNLGPEKIEEGVRMELIIFSELNFFQTISPHVWDSDH